MILRSILRVCYSLTLLTVAASAQEALTNDGVTNLVKAGMSEELILNIIAKQPGAFTLGANELVALKTAGVSERVIAAMVNKASGGGATASGASSPGGPVFSGRASVDQPGIFYKKDAEYLELLAEDVNWKTGGAMKSIASVGFIKKDLKGNITGSSSRNFLRSPVAIVISPPPGFSINDYILLPMNPEKGVREFEVGPVNQRSGIAKGAIVFGVEKVGENSFRMVFQTPLPPGEFGILTARSVGGVGDTDTSKMYTFRILP